MVPVLPLLAVAAGLVLLVGGRARKRKSSGGGIDAAWPARWAVLEPFALELELAVGWSGLADFLKVVAYSESRGRLDISHDGGAGYGPFALHYTNTTMEALGGKPALPLLADPRVAVATAASHAYRLTLLNYNYPRLETMWADIRAGWAFPSWVGNRDAAPKGKFDRDRTVAAFLGRAVQLGVGTMPASRALPVDWPGLRAALTLLGADDVAAKVNPQSDAA